MEERLQKKEKETKQQEQAAGGDAEREADGRESIRHRKEQVFDDCNVLLHSL